MSADGSKIPTQAEANEAYFAARKQDFADGKVHPAFDGIDRATRRPDDEQLRRILSGDPRRKLEPIELHTLLEMELPRPRELIGALVHEGSVGMIYAPTGAGKTFFGLGMAVSLTRAVPFLGYPVTERADVLYLDGEMAAFYMRERLAELSRPFDGETAPLEIVTPDLTSDGVPKIDTSEGYEAIMEYLDAHPSVKLVIADNLACLTTKKGDDPHGVEAAAHVQELGLACRRRQVAFWFLHHANKSGDQRGTGTRADVLDVVLKLTPVMSVDGRTEVECVFEKARHMKTEHKAPFLACLQPGENGGLVWTRSAAQLPVRERVRLMLIDGMTPGDVAAELKTARSFVYRLRTELQQSGDLPSGRGRKTGSESVVPLSPSLKRGQGTTQSRGQNQGTSRGQRGQPYAD